MGINTRIDWCDSSWNPVTGCLHEEVSGGIADDSRDAKSCH